MTALALFSAGSPAWILGFGIGLSAGLVALLLRRQRKGTPSNSSCCSADDPRELRSKSPYEKPAAEARVIRLSAEAGPASAAEMTQQQKIAAALQLAGMERPDWSASQESTPGSESDADPGSAPTS